jgi:hypothetical protein
MLYRHALVGIIILCIAGCSTETLQPIHEYQSLPIRTNASRNISTIESSILSSGTRAGWVMETRKPGHIVGKLNKDSQQAEVDIFFTEKTFSVLYRDSINLQKEERMVSSEYNRWTDQLVTVIKQGLQ